MIAPSAGTIVLVPFPFSDLSNSKLRPAVALADAEVGNLTDDAFKQIIEAVIELLQSAI